MNVALVRSSSLFIIPTLYGFNKGRYFLSTVSCVSMIASINYWRHPVPGTRKNIDLFCSKLVGLAFFLHGHFYISNKILKTLGYCNGLSIIYLFMSSCRQYELHSENWIYYHIAFHISTVIGKMIVLL